MPTVSKATLVGDMGSLGKASNKLIKQFNFPLQYEDDEQMLQADHDRMFEWDYKHATNTFKHHMNTGELGLPAWARRVGGEQVMALLKDLFKVDETYPGVEWTGYRITGTSFVGIAVVGHGVLWPGFCDFLAGNYAEFLLDTSIGR